MVAVDGDRPDEDRGERLGDPTDDKLRRQLQIDRPRVCRGAAEPGDDARESLSFREAARAEDG